jgi:hypothetical protein
VPGRNSVDIFVKEHKIYLKEVFVYVLMVSEQCWINR